MSRLLIIILTVLLPPLGIFFYTGFSGQFLINILLTLLGYFPGLVHAIYVISQHRPLR